jgi:SAM-dependent methyltransferase
VKLGLYESLHRDGPATVAQLASRTGLAPRYLREWLEQQAVCGLLAYSDPFGSAQARVYRLPPGHERVLVASDDPLSLVSGALLPIGGVAAALPHLIEAFATGAGVPDERFGDDWRQGHGGANRAVYTHQLAGWLRRHVPHVVAPQRIADIGCGAGWASLALARAYPSATVVGYDLDAQSVGSATRHAKEAGLAERVSFQVADAVSLSGQFDLVCLFDTLHELPAPVDVLRACRALRADGGTVLVMDARVADRFTAPGDEVERFQYATSVLHCLPAGLAAEGSTARGTVMRLADVRSLVRSSGYADLRYVDLDDRFHRLYELTG